jgi:hypothetical protein
MIVRITRAKVGHCQTPIYDTRLMAGVVLCGKQQKENTAKTKAKINWDRNKGIGISKGG